MGLLFSNSFYYVSMGWSSMRLEGEIRQGKLCES